MAWHTTAKSMDGLLCSPISICFVLELTTSQDPVGNNNYTFLECQ